MPYLGNNLGVAFSSYKLIDSLTASFNGTTTSFALTVNGVTPVPFPLNEQNILLSVGGVPQKPDSTGTEGFRFSGSNIVFSSAPKTGEAFWGVVLAGADRVNAGVQYPDGTASVPSITFASQTTTGFYRSGSGQIGVGINGSTPVAFSTSGVQLNGSTSGSVIIASPAVAGNNTLTLPTSNGSANQFLKNGATAGSLGYSSMVEDSSGRVGINTTLPNRKLEVSDATADNFIRVNTTGASKSGIEFANGGTVYSQLYFNNVSPYDLSLLQQYTTGSLILGTNSTERARIDSSGSLLVGTTAVPNVGITGQFGFSVSSTEVVISKSGADGLIIRTTSAASSNIRLYNLNNQVGSVSTTTTATAYNTSSDYRLKEDVQPMQGALERVPALKPVTYKWKIDGSAGEGFIAHELQEVVPECVTGTKDEVDDDGNPVYQGIDQSKLVPLLTAALQEAIAEIASLKDRVAALEAS